MCSGLPGMEAAFHAEPIVATFRSLEALWKRGTGCLNVNRSLVVLRSHSVFFVCFLVLGGGNDVSLKASCWFYAD
jgi:hypothetical protein